MLVAKNGYSYFFILSVYLPLGYFYIMFVYWDLQLCFFQWEFLPILHNKPQDRYIYQISISVNKTSSKEFDTEVFCVLYGLKGKTAPKTLSDGKRKVSWCHSRMCFMD